MLDARAFALPHNNRRWADAGCIVAIPSTGAIRHREIFNMEGAIGGLGPQGSNLLCRFLRENAGSDPGFELLVALLDDNCPDAFDVSFELSFQPSSLSASTSSRRTSSRICSNVRPDLPHSNSTALLAA